jgi:hypothetical protein
MFAIPSLTVAFAAFCVWLIVRIVNRREQWAKWTLGVLVVAAIAFPLSYGPWMWFCLHRLRSLEYIDGGGFYAPLLQFTSDGPTWLAAPYNAYLRWCMNYGVLWGPFNWAFWFLLAISTIGLLFSTALYSPIGKLEHKLGLPSFLNPPGRLGVRITLAIVSLIGLATIALANWSE